MRIIGLLALCGTVAMTCAAQETFDVSGLQSWDLDGDIDNQTMILLPTQGAPFNVILSVSYDFTIETFGGSWFSEVNARFGNSDGTFDGAWPDTFTPAPGANASGIQRFTGSFETDFHLNADGEFHLSLFESFDDNPDGIDAVLLSVGCSDYSGYSTCTPTHPDFLPPNMAYAPLFWRL